eukprot:scaffold1381_cov386-Prasinococcus_capsulatus_cf.AAC.5
MDGCTFDRNNGDIHACAQRRVWQVAARRCSLWTLTHESDSGLFCLGPHELHRLVLAPFKRAHLCQVSHAHL